MAVFRRPTLPTYRPRSTYTRPRRVFVGNIATIDGGTVNMTISMLLTSPTDTDPTVNFAVSLAMNADIGVTSLFGATERIRAPINPTAERHRA